MPPLLRHRIGVPRADLEAAPARGSHGRDLSHPDRAHATHLTVTTDADGATTVRIVIAADGASQAWASDDAADLDVTLQPDGAEGEATLSPVDVDGGDDADRDDAPVTFTLPCDA